MKTLDLTAAAILVVLGFYLLYLGQALLLPLVIAISLWYLINNLAASFNRLAVAGFRPPMPLCLTAAFLTFILVIWGLVDYFSGRIPDIREMLPVYQANLLARLENLPLESLPFVGMDGAGAGGEGEGSGGSLMGTVTEWIDLPTVAGDVIAAFGGIVGNSVLILLYMLFLFLEQGTFDRKISALADGSEKEKAVRRIIEQVRADIHKYISIKMITSTLTGVLSYIFLLALGVDFPGVWGLLIFLLNFIPTIGSIVATLFPATIALAQSNDFVLPMLVVAGIGTLQMIIGNILEPRMMGASFNISPIVIMLNLVLWGAIWGIPGMFLCVPFLIIIIIVLSRFPRTRPIAVFLSSDGNLQGVANTDGSEPSAGKEPSAGGNP